MESQAYGMVSCTSPYACLGSWMTVPPPRKEDLGARSPRGLVARTRKLLSIPCKARGSDKCRCYRAYEPHRMQGIIDEIVKLREEQRLISPFTTSHRECSNNRKM